MKEKATLEFRMPEEKLQLDQARVAGDLYAAIYFFKRNFEDGSFKNLEDAKIFLDEMISDIEVEWENPC